MSDHRSTKKPGFHRGYRQFLAEQGIAGKALPYYVWHLEDWGRYLRQERGPGGSGSGSEDGSDFLALLQGWLVFLSGNPRLEDWQIRQAADAVRLAHAGMLREGWAESVNSVLR